MCRFAGARLLRLCVRIPPWAWMSVCCECCVFSGRSLRRADHSSRGVLPTVVRRCVWSINLDNDEALAHYGGSRAINTENNVRKGNFFMIQYNLKPLICPTIYVTFGKLMAVQSVTSAYQKTAGL